MSKIDIKALLMEKAPIIDKIIAKYIPKKYNKDSLIFSCGKPRYAYNVEAPNKALAEPVWDMLSRGGKRWRPTLFLLIVEALGGSIEKIGDYVIVPEVVHNGCLTEDSVVLRGDNVPIKIKDISVGDDVFSLDKTGKLVKNKVVYIHDNGVKNVLEVRTKNRSIKTTKNHLFLVYKKDQPTKKKLTKIGKAEIDKKLREMNTDISNFSKRIFKNNKMGCSRKHFMNVLYDYESEKNVLLSHKDFKMLLKELGLKENNNYYKNIKCKYESPDVSLGWKKASDLNKGDLVVISKYIDSNGQTPDIPTVIKRSRDKNKIPTKITKDFCQLCGFVLGDGSISDGRTFLSIPENAPGRQKYEELVFNLFEKKPSLSHDGVTCCSKALSEIFTELELNQKSIDSKIPGWVFQLPREHKMSFVKGYIDSDGSVAKNGTVVFECASQNLMWQLKGLLDTNGFITSNLHERVIDNSHFKKFNKKETTLYGFQLFGPNKVLNEIGTDIEFYKKRLSVPRREMSLKFRDDIPKLPKNMDSEQLGFCKIKSVKPAGKRKTMDIQVEGTHNYIANGIVTHNTLMIDDIEDNSKERRGQPCTHIKFGTDIAINAGNFMYYIPLLPLMRNGPLPPEKAVKVYETYLQEMINLGFGQGMDIAWHKGIANADKVTEDEYLQMCAYKTGTLARMSARIAAILADGSREQVEAIGRLAETVGIAFQIQDDILNLIPSGVSKTKGCCGEDITEGKRTLMVIHTLKNNKEDAKRLIEILNMHTDNQSLRDEAIGILKKNNSIDYSKEFARKLVRESWQDVDALLPASEAKDKLCAFATFLIERDI